MAMENTTISYAKSYVRYTASFSLTLFILELNYCILLVQGRYSSVLWLKVFAPTADSDATTLLRIKSNTYCSVSVRLSRTSLAYRGIAYSHVFLLWLVTTKMCTHSEPNCASTTWISNISVYLSLYSYVH
jgi:hypothetical protein